MLVGLVAQAGLNVLLRKAKALEASMPAVLPVARPPDFAAIKPIPSFSPPPDFSAALKRELEAAQAARSYIPPPPQPYIPPVPQYQPQVRQPAAPEPRYTSKPPQP